MHYLYLSLAIVLEVLATSLLGKSEGFSRWLFAVGALKGLPMVKEGRL